MIQKSFRLSACLLTARATYTHYD